MNRKRGYLLGRRRRCGHRILAVEVGDERARDVGAFSRVKQWDLSAVDDHVDAAGFGKRFERLADFQLQRLEQLIPALVVSDLSVFSLAVQSPDGKLHMLRLPSAEYREIVAATSFKQRVRKMMEYYHADRLNYAVAGTPNRLEYDQGFFVKLGDGSADLKPIAHLYKSQVYALAEHLGVPQEILRRPPTTDTFSLPQTQEEFYFALPYRQMDLCLYGRNHGVPAADVASAVGLTPAQVERVYRDIDQKRRTTRYLHARPRLVAAIPEIHD